MSGRSYGRITVGALLIAVGIVWLLRTAGIVDIPIRALLPVALILLGGGLLVGSRSGSHPGLVALGAVITVILILGSVVAPTGGRGAGVGDRMVAPRTPSEVRDGFDLDGGTLTVDLRRLSTRPGRPEALRARVGVGRLVVLVPRGTGVEGSARVGVGSIDTFGDEEGGVGLERSIDHPGRGRAVPLDLSVGLGAIELEEVGDVSRPSRRPGRLPPVTPSFAHA